MRFPLLILLLVSLAAHAQEKSARTCRILFLNAADDAPQKLHLFDGVTSQEVELPRMNFSPVYSVAAGATALAFLPSAPPAAEAGAAPAIPAGAPVAALSETITDFYLILSSDPANTIAPVRAKVINANVAHFKRGQMLWYNLTDSKVAGQLGTRKLLSAPQSRLVLDAPAPGREDYHVNLYFQPPGKTRAEPLCETNWSHDPSSRGVFFIIKAEQSAIPRVLGFADFRENSE